MADNQLPPRHNFPVITSMDQFLSNIEDFHERDCFILREYPDFYSINYRIVSSDIFRNAWEKECRGIKFDKEGKLLARPFHKFFNQNEKPETLEEELAKYDLVGEDKEDGSMIHPIKINGELKFCTKAGVTSIAEDALEYAKSAKEDYIKFCDYCTETMFTPIFEWVAPTNRIVLKYNKPNLILLALRHNATGHYSSRGDLEQLMFHYGDIPLVKQYDLKTFNKDLVDIEGVVAHCPKTGFRVKMKTEWYVNLHRTKDMMFYEKNMIECLYTESMDDLLSLVEPEDKKDIEDWRDYVFANASAFIDDIMKTFDDLKELAIKKDFALKVQEVADNPSKKSVLFKMFGENFTKDEVSEMIKEIILRNTSSETKVGGLRGILGEKSWLDFYNKTIKEE